MVLAPQVLKRFSYEYDPDRAIVYTYLGIGLHLDIGAISSSLGTLILFYYGVVEWAPDPLPRNCYIKRPALIQYGDSSIASAEVSYLSLANEAQVCEILKSSPHPIIAQYHECIVSSGRITSLCFTRYRVHLLGRILHDPRPFDINLCLRQIENGVRHLHSLGLIHCDLCPMNVMVDDRDNSIISDFDSCRREGEELGTEAGTSGWTKEDLTVARRENDSYGIYMIRGFLFSQRKKAEKEWMHRY